MGFLKSGKETEKKFSQILKEKCSFSNEQQDIHEHWDLKIVSKVDVKGLKKVRRSDSQPNENIHWIEIKNVRGDLGWLYGDADYFAFELIDYWIVVSKEDLQNLIKEKVNKVYYDKPTLYSLYSRKGRKDVITLVKSYDLCYISSNIIKK